MQILHGIGSRRFSAEIQNKMSSDGEGFMEAYSSVGRSSGFTEETLNLSMTTKQPPSYDGKVSWLRYEELVDDWVAFTTIEASSRADSSETLTCTRQSSKMTFCKIRMKESTISRTR